MFAALIAVALANGQTTHIWIALEALDHLTDSELAALLERSDLIDDFVSGAQFPDGGYAVNDGYGEIAHWESFQGAYLRWIRDTYDPPWDEEAVEHIAFLLGLAAHGMADQVFDSMYMERAKVYDADSDWAAVSFDEATDVVWARITGPQEPQDSVPYDLMSELMLSSAGHEVSVDTLEDGQMLLGVAVDAVGYFATVDELVAEYEAAYPWGCANLADATIAGSPPLEAEIVGRYLDAVWEKLHGRDPGSVLATFPSDNSFAHPTDAASVESWISVVFAEGLVDSVAGAIAIDGPDGDHAVNANLFYGYASHVVNLSTEIDYAIDATYEVTLADGYETIEGEAVDAGYSFSFSTGPAPTEEEAGAEDSGCGCGAGAAPSALLVLVGFGAYSRRRMPSATRPHKPKIAVPPVEQPANSPTPSSSSLAPNTQPPSSSP